MKNSALEELRCFSEEFYATGKQCLTQRWKIVLTMKETFWKNNLNFLKDLPMIYGNFITLVITASEKKMKGVTFVMWRITDAI